MTNPIIKTNWFYTKNQNCELQRDVVLNRNSTQSKTGSQSDNNIVSYNNSNQSHIKIVPNKHKFFQQIAATDEIILQIESVSKKPQADNIIHMGGKNN